MTLTEAKAVLATESKGTERYAMANTIVSLYAALCAMGVEVSDV
jgi:hypothetical protein